MRTQEEMGRLFADYHAAKVASARADSLGKEIKLELTERVNSGIMEAGTAVEAGGFVAHVTMAVTKRFDTKRFEKEYPELYQEFLVEGAPVARLYFK